MIIEKKYRVDVANVNTSNLLSNSGILRLFENIACLHSDMAGYGMNQIEKTHLTWVLLNWKVHVIKRVPYGSIVNIKTWARTANVFFTLRDFEMYDEKNNLICTASSKWTLINTDLNSITRITDAVISCYEPEEKSVFGENDIVKLKKQHPCGSSEWEILRVGADFRLKCTGCGHQIMIARKLVEKNTRNLQKKSEENT